MMKNNYENKRFLLVLLLFVWSCVQVIQNSSYSYCNFADYSDAGQVKSGLVDSATRDYFSLLSGVVTNSTKTDNFVFSVIKFIPPDYSVVLRCCNNEIATLNKIRVKNNPVARQGFIHSFPRSNLSSSDIYPLSLS